MRTLVVMDAAGAEVCRLPDAGRGVFVASAVREEEEMRHDTVTLTVQARERLPLTVGCTVEVGGSRYRMNQVPRMERSGTRAGYEYTLVFESAKYDLCNVLFLLPEGLRGDYMTGDLGTMVGEVVRNANRVYPGEWAVGSVPAGTETVTEQYTERNCLAALQGMCERHGKKFRIAEDAGVKRVDIVTDGSLVEGVRLEYGHGGGAYAIERLATASEDVVTRLYAYGSGENLPTGYRHSRLCLPGAARWESYVEDASASAAMGTKEGVAVFEEVMPRATFLITEVVGRNTFRCADLAVGTPYGFKIDARWGAGDYAEWLEVRGYEDSAEAYDIFSRQVLSGSGSYKYMTQGAAHVTWNTGALSGRSFAVRSVSADGATIEVVGFTENEGDDLLAVDMPTDGGAFDIGVGDEVVISDIELPLALVRRAEDELEEAARGRLSEVSGGRARYGVTLDRIWSGRGGMGGRLSRSVGDYVHVKDAEVGVDEYLLVSRVTEDLKEESLEIELTDIKEIDRGWVRREGEYEDVVAPFAGSGTVLECEFTPNYEGDAANVRVGGGTFTDSTLMGARKRWTIAGATVRGLEPLSSYAVYAKLGKRGTSGSVVFRPERTAEARTLTEDGGVVRVSSAVGAYNEPGSFYFRIGTLSRPYVREVGRRPQRILELLYGSVTSGADNADAIADAADDIAMLEGINGLNAPEAGLGYARGALVREGGQMYELREFVPAGEEVTEEMLEPTTMAKQVENAKPLVLSRDEFEALEEVRDGRMYVIRDLEDVEEIRVGSVTIYSKV